MKISIKVGCTLCRYGAATVVTMPHVVDSNCPQCGSEGSIYVESITEVNYRETESRLRQFVYNCTGRHTDNMTIPNLLEWVALNHPRMAPEFEELK